MKILNALILIIYAIVLCAFLSYSATAATGTTYAVQLMASQKQLQTTDAVFKGLTDIHEETFTTGPVKYKYTTGWTNNWKEVNETWQKMKESGFTGSFIVKYTGGNRVVKNTTNTTGNIATTTTNTTATPNTTSGTTIFTTADGKTVSMTSKKVTTTDGKAKYETTTTTAPTTPTTTTTTVAAATPNTTTGTTIFTTADGKAVSMTSKKVTGTNQYETTTTTGPASSNLWNNWNTNSNNTAWNNTTTDTKTTANGNTVTTTTKKVTKTTMWVNPDGTTTTAPSTTTATQNWNTTTTPAETTTDWNTNTTTTPAATNTTKTTTHVYRGYGETLTQNDPTFPGGDDALYVWIRNNLSYVLQTQSTGVWKHGYLVFTVDRNGKALNPMMMVGISKEVDAAILNMVNKMPNWNPATVAGNPIEKQFIMPLDCFIPAPVPTTSTK